jgi:hypothetical protein
MNCATVSMARRPAERSRHQSPLQRSRALVNQLSLCWYLGWLGFCQGVRHRGLATYSRSLARMIASIHAHPGHDLAESRCRGTRPSLRFPRSDAVADAFCHTVLSLWEQHSCEPPAIGDHHACHAAHKTHFLASESVRDVVLAVVPGRFHLAQQIACAIGRWMDGGARRVPWRTVFHEPVLLG